MAPVDSSNVTVHVMYFGLIRECVAEAQERVEIAAGARVRDLLAQLGERHGPSFQDALLVGDEKLVPNATVILNGSNILHQRGLDTAIEGAGSARILLMPPFIGGG